MENTQLKRIVVTGGNAGIGYALCKQAALENNCYVYMGTRNQERGQKALDEMPEGCKGKVELLLVDVADEASVKSAAATLKEKLGDNKLYALVNNAGVGLSTGVTQEHTITTNVYGPKLMTENFVSLIDPTVGRIVNLGSGAGPMYTSKVSEEDQKAFWNNADCTWEQLETKMKVDQAAGMDDMRLYCLSKAVLAVYTMQTAKQYPNIMTSVVTPGLVETNMTAKFDMPGKITPEQGTISTRHCLFNELQGNGWFYGSDGIRSPLLKGRNPGEPAYDGN